MWAGAIETIEVGSMTLIPVASFEAFLAVHCAALNGIKTFCRNGD